ncbi:hypothetical protein M3Y99_01046500 [Aphelenchoides fujianensis]|nr:hypothetical protein M3Y99_01046500 [Aphelenchoides fujianensis]
MSALPLVLLVLAAYCGQVHGTECFYCSSGQPKELAKLLGLYSNAQTTDSLFDATVAFSETCGTNGTALLKTFNCTGSCLFAESVEGKAVLSGCARDDVHALGHSTDIRNNLHFRIAFCTNNKCNENYETAKANRDLSTTTPPPTSTTTTTTTTTTTAVPLVVSNGENKTNKKTTTAPTHPKTVKPITPKPSGAASTFASVGLLLAGLAVYLVSN